MYCDVLSSEHPDNERFLRDVEKWTSKSITRLKSGKYKDIEDVFEKTKYMAGIAGARCTVEMKKVPRYEFQAPSDIHIFGFSADEEKRALRFEKNNPDLNVDWILLQTRTTKEECYKVLLSAGIKLPEMYLLGYKNNNCIGCVKATSPAYWSKVRADFPEIFGRRAAQSKRLGIKLCRFKGKRIFLDELPYGDYTGYRQENISCGPECADKKWTKVTLLEEVCKHLISEVQKLKAEQGKKLRRDEILREAVFAVKYLRD